MRKSGILLHVSSLPSEYGIGKFGSGAYKFVDFLNAGGVKLWQVLPLSPTSYGDSPYQSFSSFAGNPYFIDFNILKSEKLLRRSDYEKTDWQDNPTEVNYTKIYQNCFKTLKKAYKNFTRLDTPKGMELKAECEAFAAENDGWLDDYALFMALKFKNKGRPWHQWGKKLAMRDPDALKKSRDDLSGDIQMFKFIQFQFYRQWLALKSYANEKGIEIIGDIPIYVSYDSAEVWTTPELFQLDGKKRPLAVAGCPPDSFSLTGQLWGNPLYDWAFHKKSGFDWWIKRMKYASKLYDIIRIDHFRGFESYYSIPYGSETAENGKWEKGPGIELFRQIRKKLGRLNIIAEDLGFITPEVRSLVNKLGYPGMKILQYAFDGTASNEYLPHNYKNPNCAAYIGTHDNDTLKGWLKNADKSSVDYCKQYTNSRKKKDIPWNMIRMLWGSTADYAIVQLQDLLMPEDNNFGRMNIPGVVGNNWTYRIENSDLNAELAGKILELNKIYGR